MYLSQARMLSITVLQCWLQEANENGRGDGGLDIAGGVPSSSWTDTGQGKYQRTGAS